MITIVWILEIIVSPTATHTKAMDLFVSVILALALCVLATDVMVLGATLQNSFVLDLPSPKRCHILRTRTKIKYVCREMYLDHVPARADSGIQIMDLTNNSIKDLRVGSFSRYTSLEMLLLDMNRIFEIKAEIVAELQYLHSLHIFDNSLAEISPSLFELPYLKNLYLTANYLNDDAFTFNVTSGLEILELGKNRLKRVPSIGIQPHLLHLNLSANYISHVSVEDLAPFCSLKTLDLTKNNVKFDSSNCDCHLFNSWARTYNITVMPKFTCDKSESCSRSSPSNETLNTFNKCLDLIKVQQAAAKAKSTWITVGSCASVVIVCLLIALYCVSKRNKKRDRKLKEEQRLAANNANTELLNGNLPEQLPIKTLQE